jgi:flagellar biosynthesis protein FliR
MSRLAPQMQVFYVGMPAKTGLGLLMLVLVFPGTVATMVGMFDSMMRSVLLLFARV